MTVGDAPGPSGIAASRSFWTAAAVVALALWASAAPTITYPRYAAKWSLTTTETTAIFATFPVVLAVVLAVFGGLADYIGRRRTILFGLTASLIGAMLFTIAPSLAVVFIARALTGVGVGLTMVSATAAMVEFSSGSAAKSRASAVATAATAVGLALAVLTAGTLIDLAPWPTHLSFAVLAVALLVALAAATRLPPHTPAEAVGRWRPRGLRVPATVRPVFMVGTLSVTAGFTIGAVVLSLGADIARELIGSSDALIGASTIALFAFVMGGAAIASRMLRPQTSSMIGSAVGITGLALLPIASTVHALPLLLVFAVVAGLGYALLFTGGLAMINTYAPHHHRAGMVSATYLVAYLTQGITALVLGIIATAVTLQTAIDWGCAAIGLLLAITLLATLRLPR